MPTPSRSTASLTDPCYGTNSPSSASGLRLFFPPCFSNVPTQLGLWPRPPAVFMTGSFILSHILIKHVNLLKLIYPRKVCGGWTEFVISSQSILLTIDFLRSDGVHRFMFLVVIVGGGVGVAHTLNYKSEQGRVLCIVNRLSFLTSTHSLNIHRGARGRFLKSMYYTGTCFKRLWTEWCTLAHAFKYNRTEAQWYFWLASS